MVSDVSRDEQTRVEQEPWETLAVPLDDLRLAPTDIAMFIRYDQCERLLRLRLHQRAYGQGFMTNYGARQQSIPPLLRLSGSEFEASVEAEIERRYPITNLASEIHQSQRREADNSRIIDVARALGPGSAQILAQARVEGRLGEWRLRGDIDLLRMERRADGTLAALVADIKSSRVNRLEHNLQVTFYALLLERILDEAGIDCEPVEMGILFRGPVHFDNDLPEVELAEIGRQREAARATFGVENGLFEAVAERQVYSDVAEDMVTAHSSLARRVAGAPFESIPFHLDHKCDQCVYNEFCMRWAAERDDLSLIPHLTSHDKAALRRNRLTNVRQIAALPTAEERGEASAEQRDVRQKLATTWPLAPRVDELIYRARQYRRSRGDDIEAPYRIPHKGYPSLPYTAPGHNPNLITIYVDAGHDYREDRLYLLAARVVAHEQGEPARTRDIVRMTDGPPDSQREEELVRDWTSATIQALLDLVAPDAKGELSAPIHLLFWDRMTQTQLLNGLARHFEAVIGATPLYDFVTQLAAYDSPLASYLQEEIRDFRNFSMLCQSLQSVATRLGFDWNEPEPFRKIFRTGLFDYPGKFDRIPEGETSPWFYRRARFSSQIPLEYAYAVWGRLGDDSDAAVRNPRASYRRATADLLRGFASRRLDALQHIAATFDGNDQTEKRDFDLTAIASFSDTARSLAEAIEEFIIIEQHVALAAWKAARLPSPEQRVLNGDSLVVRFRDATQERRVRDWNRDNRKRNALRQRFRAEFFAQNPNAKRARYTKEQNEVSKWDYKGMRVQLELETDGIDCDLDDLLGVSGLREDSWVVLFPRWDVDSRVPEDEQRPYTPTFKQLLYGARGTLTRYIVERDEQGRALSARVEVEMRPPTGGAPGFAFSDGLGRRPFEDDMLYTIESEPNDLTASRTLKVIQGITSGDGANALYDRLDNAGTEVADWTEEAQEGQRRFMAGLEALDEIGKLHPFEAGKREYISGHGATPTLLVQGPPGTGKSYATAFAVLARVQGAMAAGRDFRALLSCKTHAATDVLLDEVSKLKGKLAAYRDQEPELFERYFDPRLLSLPLFRLRARGAVRDGVIPLNGQDKQTGEDHIANELLARRWCVAAGTPNAVYKIITDRWNVRKEPGNLFERDIIDCLVIDEASQLGLPEAIMTALPLRRDGQIIVVGDHRQMPPIIQHDWERELRRTAREFASHESLFTTLRRIGTPEIQFAQSFRLHEDMANYLRDAIYQQDGIAYYSLRDDVLKDYPEEDAFVDAVLSPEHPLIVVVHNEGQSQKLNDFEKRLIAPIIHQFAAPYAHALDPSDGFGIVVPHRAQRAAVQDTLRFLGSNRGVSVERMIAAVDTVERFQGGERDVILVSATESDRQYLLTAGDFLYDPRRLTVAVSRARKKMILVASSNVFNLFSADQDLFENSLLWKRLLRYTCTTCLWSGDRHGKRVVVWGNHV